ncbi:aspartate racemase [Ruminococcaceae bacterium YAD3003]|nr:aspartate racemase [Ruminococcaceae bacterium YAD3003]
MKKIGLVGGTGPESTLMYYKILNSEIDCITEGRAMPDIAIESVNFPRAWNNVTEGRYDLLADYLLEKLECLDKSGSEVISLTAVTMHVVYDELAKRFNKPIISIPRVVAEEISSKGIKRIGLLGTIFTMEKDYMKKDLIESGIEVFVPNDEERQLVAKRIFEELEKGIVKESTLKELTDIITRMKNDDGIEGVILGCTELPLILNSDNCPVACFDAVEIHIRKLIELSME